MEIHGHIGRGKPAQPPGAAPASQPPARCPALSRLQRLAPRRRAVRRARPWPLWGSGSGGQGAGCRVQGVGFGVNGIRGPFGIHGVVFWVWGSGCRVKDAGCRVQGVGFRVWGSACRVWGFRVWVAGFRVQGAGCRVQGGLACCEDGGAVGRSLGRHARVCCRQLTRGTVLSTCA